MQANHTKSGSGRVALHQVRIQDDFWSYYIGLVKDVVVPYQWEALNDRVEAAEPSGAVRNFRIAAGLEQGEFYGMVFQDSDVAKWLEAVAYLLETDTNQQLEQIADEMIDIIALAQREDGYLNTYFQLKEPDKRWTNLTECHELYCAGHMIEAGVAYYRATGKNKLLQVVSKFADYIDQVFGNEPGKLAGYDGHQEIELALVKLYEVTGEKRYLQLSQYFLDQRGQQPSFFQEEFKQRGGKTFWPGTVGERVDLEYHQAHLPVREQETATGHAVRLMYMLAGMADVAGMTGDETMLAACRKLWDNVTGKQMYITGGVGSMPQGEAFSFDYNLPNDTVYAETCASIGLIFFAHRMLRIAPESRYADVLERALYNTVVGGMARDGKHFFYVNPLEVDPKACGGGNHSVDHVKPVRQGWFGCACCPPNVARLLASLGEYIYSVQGDILYTHLYIGGEAELKVGAGTVKVTQTTNYPWEGTVQFAVEPAGVERFTLALRIPDWCPEAKIAVNGEVQPMDAALVRNGYYWLQRDWQAGDKVELALQMPVTRMYSHPLVRANAGKVALQRGPLVYCLEEADQGAHLHEIILPRSAALRDTWAKELLGGVVTVEAEGIRLSEQGWQGGLYSSAAHPSEEQVALKFIPYYAWANRGEGEMTVWLREH